MDDGLTNLIFPNGTTKQETMTTNLSMQFHIEKEKCSTLYIFCKLSFIRQAFSPASGE